jgi:hypothetical protein
MSAVDDRRPGVAPRANEPLWGGKTRSLAALKPGGPCHPGGNVAYVAFARDAELPPCYAAAAAFHSRGRFFLTSKLGRRTQLGSGGRPLFPEQTIAAREARERMRLFVINGTAKAPLYNWPPHLRTPGRPRTSVGEAARHCFTPLAAPPVASHQQHNCPYSTRSGAVVTRPQCATAERPPVVPPRPRTGAHRTPRRACVSSAGQIQSWDVGNCRRSNGAPRSRASPRSWRGRSLPLSPLRAMAAVRANARQLSW